MILKKPVAPRSWLSTDRGGGAMPKGMHRAGLCVCLRRTGPHHVICFVQGKKCGARHSAQDSQSLVCFLFGDTHDTCPRSL